METKATEGIIASGSSTVQPVLLPRIVITMIETDDKLNTAGILLKPLSSSPSHKGYEKHQKSTRLSVEGININDIKKASITAERSSQINIAEDLEKVQESRICKLCMNADRDVLFLPCTHMIICSGCATAVVQCPICYKDINKKIFLRHAQCNTIED